ncbi:unnamed protein product [Closterium sp. NIES-54]
MAGPEERGGGVAGGSGEAQAQGQPRDSAMAPMQPSLGPPRDEPRVFGLDKFNGDNFAEWSFKMENIFDHYDLLEVMERTEKRPENDTEKSPMTPRADLLTELEPSPVKHVTSALGQRAEVKGMGKAMFKGANGKMVGLKNFTHYPFSSSEATAKAPLDEVVMDVVGPLKLGAAGAEYFLTIVDVYTRMTWVYVLSKKSDVAETVTTDWLPMMERQQDRLRGNRTITETARGLLIEAGLPDYFWPDAVQSACVAKNRALTHVGAEKWVPCVEWIGRKPKVDMLRVFGCMCMALVPKHLRHNKLGAKAI